MYLILACFRPTVTLYPGPSNVTVPLQFRRSQDFYISTIIKLKCAESLEVKTQWSIFNCSLNSTCSTQAKLDELINTTLSELFVPARILSYGSYKMELTVTMVDSPRIFSIDSAYVKINPSGITANLVLHGTSLVTSGERQDLILNPGNYSINPDESIFNTSVSVVNLIILWHSECMIC